MQNPELPVVPRTIPARGFTLIELMIVVAVIAVLAVIAINSYQYALVKSRRAEAKGCVQEGAQYMERYYTTNLTYAGAALVPCSADVSTYYTVGFSGTPDATTYIVQAVPQGTQATADTTCGTLTIDQSGARGPNNAACW